MAKAAVNKKVSSHGFKESALTAAVVAGGQLVIEEPGKLIEPVHHPRIEMTYDARDRKQPYKVTFYNCQTRSLFQKMITHLFQKELIRFRANLVMEGETDGGK